VVSISAGPEHAAGVTDAATAQLWGSNEFYQLAQGQDTPSSARPVPVLALAARRVLAIACGGSHTLAIIGDGAPGAAAAGVGAGAGAGSGGPGSPLPAVAAHAPGLLFAWGTGTVGQLGLGSTMPILDGPAQVPMPPGPDGKPSLVSQVFAGLVSSAAISAAGECFVWGDASAGRLGLPGIPDTTPPDTVPQFVNAHVKWTPTPLTVSPSDVGMAPGGDKPAIVSVALGGSFSLFSVWTGAGPGCVLLASGALGWDITRDTYGYPQREEREVNAMIDDEVKVVPRRPTPTPVAPFGVSPIILSAHAGARHAAAVVADASRGGAPRLYTAGKGWLGHTGTLDTVLLERPAVSAGFAPVSGALADEDIVDAGCGHSHTLARTSDGRLYAWGRGDSGELGHGNLSDRSMPVPSRVADGHHVTAIAAGSYYSAAVLDAGFAPRQAPSAILDAARAKWMGVSVAQEMAAVPPVVEVKKPAAAAAAAGGGGGGGGGGAAGGDKKKREAEAQAKARAMLDDGELPPDWTWDQTDDGEVYYVNPDGETQWDDPRDDWDSYWPHFLPKK
jgi:hypothetical protein